MDPYEVLGLRPGAPLDEAEAAYHRLLRVHHPDLHHGGGPDELAAAERRTQALNTAIRLVRDAAGTAPGSPAGAATSSWSRSGSGTPGPSRSTGTDGRSDATGADVGDTHAGDTHAGDTHAGDTHAGDTHAGRTGSASGRGRATAGAGTPPGAAGATGWSDGVGLAGEEHPPVTCPFCAATFHEGAALKEHAGTVHGLWLDAPPRRHRRHRRFTSRLRLDHLPLWALLPLNGLVAVGAATVARQLSGWTAFSYWVFAVAMAPTLIRLTTPGGGRL